MSEPLDIRHLRYFLAVAEAGSFSRAADRLGISQPSVSQQMRDLEAGLRVPLFQRRGKRILRVRDSAGRGPDGRRSWFSHPPLAELALRAPLHGGICLNRGRESPM